MGPDVWALEACGITKAFGHKWALKGIDLHVPAGVCLAIFGPNGAGKTTLLKTLATLIRPTSGSLQLMGMDVGSHAIQVRRFIGMVGHQPLLYDELTAHENLRFYGRMYDQSNLDERIATVLRQVGMEGRSGEKVRTLSHGMQRRVSLARALLHDPQLLLLDEPEAGLDAHALELLQDVLARLKAEGRTVIMTSHNVEWGLRWASQALVLTNGRVVYQGAAPFPQATDFRSSFLTGARAAS